VGKRLLAISVLYAVAPLVGEFKCVRAEVAFIGMQKLNVGFHAQMEMIQAPSLLAYIIFPACQHWIRHWQ